MDLIQGYGLTENLIGLAVQAADDLRTGIAGAPVASVEVKLESTPEICDPKGIPYLSTDIVDVEGNKVFGRGEIVCRGPGVSCGYYMMPDTTKESFKVSAYSGHISSPYSPTYMLPLCLLKDGWFYTGDIGQFMSDGSLRIIDRKKNLVKLKGGEYIALEKMEMTYGNSAFVEAICCYGDGDMDRPVTLVQLNKAAVLKWAEVNNVYGDIETLKEYKELNQAVLDNMHKEYAKSNLSHLEKIVGVSLLTSLWTPENGCLTAANKLQCRVVIQQFQKELLDVKRKGIF
jgi:long-chain acyl-CoA synthetase